MKGPTVLVQHFHLWGEYTGARALLDINLIWFGYIAPIPVGRREVIYSLN